MRPLSQLAINILFHGVLRTLETPVPPPSLCYRAPSSDGDLPGHLVDRRHAVDRHDLALLAVVVEQRRGVLVVDRQPVLAASPACRRTQDAACP